MDPAQFFIESEYRDAQNQPRPCFLITRKGCDVRGYIAAISTNPKMDSLDFFIDSTYQDANGEFGFHTSVERPEFIPENIF